jgi:CheY-like chemotaxis protein
MSLILVVDDDSDQRELYMALLEDNGYEVVGAPDGLAALELAARLRPVLVLTDWHMPRMDGIELCKALRRSPLLHETRLILHSSDIVPEPWHADLCLQKRGEPALIEDAVAALLSPQVAAKVKRSPCFGLERPRMICLRMGCG